MFNKHFLRNYAFTKEYILLENFFLTCIFEQNILLNEFMYWNEKILNKKGLQDKRRSMVSSYMKNILQNFLNEIFYYNFFSLWAYHIGVKKLTFER